MSGEGRTPSTRNARTVDQRGAGTGQHSAARVDIGEGLRFPRIDDSPSKTTGPEPAFGNTRRNEASGIDVQPPSVERTAKMVKDTGTKTARERAFAAEMSDRKMPLTGTNDRAFYPDALEEQKNAFSAGDGKSGSQTGFRPQKAQ